MKNELITSNNFTTNDLIEISKRVSASGLLGKYNENQIFTLMMLSYKDGTNPVQASMDYHIIQGKPALSSQATLSRFQKAGGKIKYIKRSDTECIIEFSHDQAGSLTVEWNLERARKAGLNINRESWQKYPRQMLSARCLAEGVRALYPACLDGLYLVEEVQDFDKSFEKTDKKSSVNVIEHNDNTIDNSRYDIDTNTYLIDDSEQYSIVPSGTNKGKKWEDCDIGVLSKALEYYTSKSPNTEYCKVIEPILENKLSVCEEKKDKGVKWADMETEKLEDYYNRYKSGKLIGFAEERANYIEKILLERNIDNKGYMYPSSDDKDNKKENKKVADVEVSEDENPFDVDYDADWDGDMGMNKDDKDEEGLFQ